MRAGVGAGVSERAGVCEDVVGEGGTGVRVVDGVFSSGLGAGTAASRTGATGLTGSAGAAMGASDAMCVKSCDAFRRSTLSSATSAAGAETETGADVTMDEDKGLRVAAVSAVAGAIGSGGRAGAAVGVPDALCVWV